MRHGVVVIFSKTYCEYSKKAKDLLLRRYMIVPTPLVVELDIHPHGRLLQEVLWRQTGRKTVPVLHTSFSAFPSITRADNLQNIMITGESIGGNDDIQLMEEQGILADTIHRMAGKLIQRMMRLKD